MAEASETYYSELGRMVFSPDGDIAYVAKKGEKQVVVWNGHEGPEFDRIVFISFVSKPAPAEGYNADSRNNPNPGQMLIYIGQNGKQEFLVVDGVQSEQGYQKISFGGVLGDGRLYYTVQDSQGVAVVIGDNISPFYENIWSLMSFPDNQHIAYWASTKENSFVVIDTVQGQAYDKIVDLGKLSRY